jgi:hypothetical protein
MLFDKDYTPEGFAQEFAYKPNDFHVFKALGTAFILDEIGTSTSDPYMFGGQVRWDATWSPKLQTSIGSALLAIINRAGLTNGAVPDVGAGNTRLGPTGILANSFTTLYLDGSATYNLESFPAYNGPFPITLGGDFIQNFAADDDDIGYSFGLTFGRAGKKGLWEITYRYTELQADAWFEEVVESDFGAFYKFAPPGAPGIGYRSGTNLRGHWMKGTYNFYDSLSFSVAYFVSDLIHEPPGTPYNSGTRRLFVEAVWKY